MAISDLKIRNLDGTAPVEIATAKLPANKLKTEANGAKLVWSSITEDPQFPKLKVLEVSWTDDNGSNSVRGNGDNAKYDGTAKTFTITDLSPVSSFGLSVNGKLKIKDPKTGPEDPATATISVRIGNMGAGTNKQWVIDLSDKQDGADGSSLNVTALIAWAKEKAGDTSDPKLDPEIKDKDGVAVQDKLKDFIIDFREFHFNITKKTFSIDVRSQKGASIVFGAFEITEIGFQLTNEPPKAKKELPAPANED